MADRRIAAAERACARLGGISSQPSNFRGTDVKLAVQAAGLRVTRVELRGGSILIIPADQDRGAADDDSEKAGISWPAKLAGEQLSRPRTLRLGRNSC